MHTLSSQTETRRFHAWMHGLHARFAVTARMRGDTGPYSDGVSGPNNTTPRMSVSDAKWGGPLSALTSNVDMEKRVSSSRRLVAPIVDAQRSAPRVPTSVRP